MKTTFLFCCLMVVGGLAFGQKTLTPDPGDAAKPGVVASTPASSTTTSSGGGGSTVSSGGGEDNSWLFDWWDAVNSSFELVLAIAEEEEDD